MDIRSAYRSVPVHLDHWWLMRIFPVRRYQSYLSHLVYAQLPSYIFMALADAAEWIIRQAGIEFVIHYLDDFLIVAPPQDLMSAPKLYIFYLPHLIVYRSINCR